MDNNNDQVLKKTELVIDALSYAHKNELDINNESDVKEILKAVDPEDADNTDVVEFMSLLQATNNLMQANAEQRKSVN
jgi:hypothetical protein